MRKPFLVLNVHVEYALSKKGLPKRSIGDRNLPFFYFYFLFLAGNGFFQVLKKSLGLNPLKIEPNCPNVQKKCPAQNLIWKSQESAQPVKAQKGQKKVLLAKSQNLCQ